MRNAQYIPVAEIPMVDLSAQYEAAKARREEAELRKLEYLNSFQKNRGLIAEGVRPEVEKLWDEIQDSLASGDMSFEAKKKRQELYNNYAGIAADAVNWTRALNEREATILANPDKFTNPTEVLGAIEQDRFRPISAGAIASETSSLPSLSKFYRYKLESMVPGDKAIDIVETLRKTGAINKFYDENTGKIDRNKVSKYVADWALVNKLNEEEQDAALASVLIKSGTVKNDLAGLSKIQSLEQPERDGFLVEWYKDLDSSVYNLLDSDIQTEKEKENADLDLYRRKLILQQRYSTKPGGSNKAGPTYNLFAEDVPLVVPAKQTNDGRAISMGKTDAKLLFNFPVSGAKPIYVDPETNTKYNITYAGIGIDGNPVLVGNYSVPRARGSAAVASKTIPLTNEVLSSLSNAKTAAAIAGAIDEMSQLYNQYANPSTPEGQSYIMNRMYPQGIAEGAPAGLTQEQLDYNKYKMLYGLGQ